MTEHVRNRFEMLELLISAPAALDSDCAHQSVTEAATCCIWVGFHSRRAIAVSFEVEVAR